MWRSPPTRRLKAFLRELTHGEALPNSRQVTLSVCHILPVDTFRDTDDALGVIEGVLSARQVREQHILFREVDTAAIASVRREMNIETALQECIPEATGFSLHCQPIYDCVSGRFVSGELLLRFSTPALGNVSPGEFIPLAERNALSSALDKMVVDMAFRAIAGGCFARTGFRMCRSISPPPPSRSFPRRTRRRGKGMDCLRCPGQRRDGAFL